MKICKVCNTYKPITDFYNKYSACKICVNIKSKEWNKNNPDKVKTHRRKQRLKKKYGISIEEYQKIFLDQKGICKLCGKEHKRRPLNVDHCHKTGKVRGLLCDKCNMALGLLDDNINLIDRIKEYLQ